MWVTAKKSLEAARRAKLRFDPRLDSYALPPWQAAGKAKYRIGVVGGGIAGLTAAWLLARLGHEVVVFEARDRPGGRIYTLHLPHDPELHAEVGAARISDEHRRCLYWIRRSSLRLEPMYPLAGRLVRLDEHGRRVGRDIARVSTHVVHHLISGSLDWSSQYSGNFGSARSLVLESLTKPNWYRIAGGAAGLPLAIAADLGDSLRVGTRVLEVDQTDTRVRIIHECAGASGSDTVDRVILAVPLSTQRDLEFSPPLSDFKRSIAADSRQQSSIRVFVQLRDRSWMQSGVCGFGSTHQGYEVWHPTYSSRSDRSLLVLYAQGPSAKRLVELDPGGRTEHAVSVLDSMFPGVKALREFATSFCWDEDPWARGAQSLLREQDHVPWEEVRRPEGLIHFAGECTTPGGWIEDALASAHRVVGEICGVTQSPKSERTHPRR